MLNITIEMVKVWLLRFVKRVRFSMKIMIYMPQMWKKLLKYGSTDSINYVKHNSRVRSGSLEINIDKICESVVESPRKSTRHRAQELDFQQSVFRVFSLKICISLLTMCKWLQNLCQQTFSPNVNKHTHERFIRKNCITKL